MKKNIIAIIILLLAVSVVGGFYFLFKNSGLTYFQGDDMSVKEVVARWFEPLVEMYIKDVKVNASIARTSDELKQGLSDTPFLPNDIVKLFVFPDENYWGIWMKDMNYAIDILWIDKDGKIVHKEVDVSPDTYPETFEPRLPAKYVIETSSGFMNKYDIKLGDRVVLPQIK